MFSHHNINYKKYSNQLGQGKSRLSVSCYLLDNQGEVTAKSHFNKAQSMPLASVAKIAIAIAVLQQIYSTNQLNFDDQVDLTKTDLCPGLPTNTFDRLFFSFSNNASTTVADLLKSMLKESDNTAADRLLGLVGGPSMVNQLLNGLNIKGVEIKQSFRELLADYYDVPTEKSFLNVAKLVCKVKSAFVMRDNEQDFVSREPRCYASGVAKLLNLLIRSSKSTEESWLKSAAIWIIETMQACKTGEQMIKQAYLANNTAISTFGHKTGSIGGILNDAAFLQLNSGDWLVISIFTCLSPLEKVAREKIISTIAQELIEEVLQHQVHSAPVAMYP